jgi:hypothetical protein
MSAILDIGTVITVRDRELLRALAIARVLDASQVQVVGGFRSLRRTNRRLLKLVRAGVLKRWFVGTLGGGRKALYGLSLHGASMIGEARAQVLRLPHDSLITHSEFLAHQDAVNAVFLLARFNPLPSGLRCLTWHTFREPFSPAVPLVPDGYFEIAEGDLIHPMFLEADLGTERATVWKRKVELYLKFAIGGEFECRFRRKRFRVLVVLPSLRRLESVRRTVARRTPKLFWFALANDIRAQGIAAPIWLRPVGDERLPIL